MTSPRLANSPYAEYTAHLREGRLAYQVGPDGRAVFFPRVVQPGTGSMQLEWRISRGLGTVYATTSMHYRHETPLNLVLVDLDEGFRIMSRVEGAHALPVRIGMRVCLKVAPASGDADPYPLFAPSGEHVHG